LSKFSTSPDTRLGLCTLVYQSDYQELNPAKLKTIKAVTVAVVAAPFIAAKLLLYVDGKGYSNVKNSLYFDF
jgi:hypothetical protein